MALGLLLLIGVNANYGEGTVLGSLVMEGEAEGSESSQPLVLSCGGIHIPQSQVSEDFKNWQQIVNLPGQELSARIFGFSPPSSSPLQDFQRREFLN